VLLHNKNRFYAAQKFINKMGGRKMKHFTKALLITIIVISANLFANPIIIFHINEIIPDSASFTIEIINNKYSPIDSLNGWYLTSLSDTAYFKDNLSTDDTFLVFTQDSLKKPLSLNSENDIITLWNSDNYQVGSISYGKVKGSNIGIPKAG